MFGYLQIQITDITRSSYPCFATFHFRDVNNKVITVKEKLDILTSRDLSVPINGFFLTCKITKETENDFLIDISKPYGVLSVDDKCVFCVKKDMISNQHFDES